MRVCALFSYSSNLPVGFFACLTVFAAFGFRSYHNVCVRKSPLLTGTECLSEFNQSSSRATPSP
jgi:hypothetical protein